MRPVDFKERPELNELFPDWYWLEENGDIVAGSVSKGDMRAMFRHEVEGAKAMWDDDKVRVWEPTKGLDGDYEDKTVARIETERENGQHLVHEYRIVYSDGGVAMWW